MIDFRSENMGDQLTALDIRQIRGKYGLTQQAFAQLLGIGEASMVRYENGKAPSRANANLIRAAANPWFMAECLDRDGDKIPEPQREKAEQIVYSMVTFDEEGKIMDINEIYMLTLEQEILNEKAAEIMSDITRLYFAAQKSGDTVREMIYDDILKQMAHAKRQIIKENNKGKIGIAEIRGQIDALNEFALLISTRAA